MGNFLRGKFLVSLSLALAALANVRGEAAADDDGIAQIVEKNAGLVVNQPDRFAWLLFIAINKQAKQGSQDALWETWATDEDTFPSSPNPNKPPTWPGGAPRMKALRPSFQLRQIQIETLRSLGQPASALPQITPGGTEEVRRNKSAFDYIVNNKLYYREGLMDAAKRNFTVDLPRDSIEIKAQWKQIAEADKPRYHWNVDANGKLFGLIGLHITSKAIDIWNWSTFEHVDNPNRVAVQPARDNFGVDPPNSDHGSVSSELTKLFQEAGLGPEWSNYRLDNSQVDFVDVTGRPTTVGNSVLEVGFVATSSCTTCHAFSRVNASGEIPMDFMESNSPLRSRNGAPNPTWFYDTNGNRVYMQLDFIWAFAFAQSAAP